MDALIARLSGTLPQPVRRFATPGRIGLLSEFIRFGIVGACGFVVDTAIVYAVRGSVGIYAAGVLSYLIAATIGWSLNRAWTFRGRGGQPAHRQLAMFLVANLLGFALNRGTFFTLVALSPLCAAQPVFAIFAGMLVAMFANFGMSRAIVFRD